MFSVDNERSLEKTSWLVLGLENIYANYGSRSIRTKEHADKLSYTPY